MRDNELEARPSVFAAILALTVALRLLPHALTAAGVSIGMNYPWNFSPVLPACMFGAAFVHSRRWAVVGPLAAWLASDLALGLLHWELGWAVYPGQAFTYAAIGLCILTSFALRKRVSINGVIGVGLATAVLFYVVTHIGTWAMTGLYPKTAVGLVQCFTNGIPFFRYTVLSQVIFLPVLFSPWALRSAATRTPSKAVA